MSDEYNRIADQLRGTTRFPLGLVLLAVAITVLLPLGIGLLRYSVDPSPSYALAFTMFAIGTCLASGISSHVYGDSEADRLHCLVKETKKAEKKIAKLGRSKAVANHASAEALKTSKVSEQTLNGFAQAHQVAADSHDGNHK